MLIILASLLAAAAADKPGTHDYPLIQRFPGQLIIEQKERVWDTARFEVKGAPAVNVEGHKIETWYEMPKGVEKPSPLEWSRNYQNALTAAGWKIDSARDGFVSAHLEKEGREIRAWLDVNGAGGSHFVIVEKAPMPRIIEAGKATPPDYAAIPRLPGQKAPKIDEKRFDAHTFAMASGPAHRVEGRKIELWYDMEKGSTVWSGLHMSESYRSVFGAEGWSPLSFRPGFITAMLDDNGKQTWAQIDYSEGSGSSHIVVVEQGEMKQVVSASSLVDQLKKEGHVAFQVHFDSGQDVIKPESKPAIAQMVEMLKSDPALKVEVQGHTDALGDDKADQILSEKRAHAVMAALVSDGIEAARLTAKGYGKTRPVADNETEGGRALNRRVELQKR